MDILNDISKLWALIDINYLLVFMLFSYALKNPIAEAIPKLNKTIIVFIIGTILAIPFWLVFNADKMNLLVTYAIGTSLHELIIGFIIKKVKAIFNSKE